MLASAGAGAETLFRPDTETIAVATAICTATRTKITGVLSPYHVRHEISHEYIVRDTSTGFPLYGVATIRVKRGKVAIWAEYLLLRSGKFIVTSRPKHPKNAAWAKKHDGLLPTPWDARSEKSAMVEKKCKHDPETGRKLTLR